MEKTKPIQETTYFTLAGVIPVAGQPLDYNFPWHDSLMPIGNDYLAVERSVYECAMAGCESIWIVCHKEMQSLIRHRIGDWIIDPVWTAASRGKYGYAFGSEQEKTIPIFYVPIHPKDRDKRDCLAWSIIYGSMRAFSVSKIISKWVVPDRYYVSFPHGVHSVRSLRKHRKDISNHKKKFYISHNGETVRDGKYLSFTFDVEDWKSFRRIIRGGTGTYAPGAYFDEKENTVKGELLPKEERHSAKYFSLKEVFGGIDLKGQTVMETEQYFGIDNWEDYASYMGSDYAKYVIKPKMILKYHEHNPFGQDNIKDI
jgi:hypothetical protein